jgi:hypothetical protein
MEFPRSRRISRRQLLRIAGVAGLTAVATSAMRRISSIESALGLARDPRTAKWSDPNTWGGRVPKKTDFVVVSKPIILDINARVQGLLIKRKGSLIFHPLRNVTLESTRNVVVRGGLSMRPGRPSVIHRLLFPRVNEQRFKGGATHGTHILPSDVGLWVTGGGRLGVEGSPKLAWSRVTGSVPAGTASITLQHGPVGWRVGDEIAITPTLSPSTPNHDIAYDVAVVAAVDQVAQRVTLQSPTKFEHPAVNGAPGVVLTAEVLNLTRNVRIEGTADGRSHVWIRSSRRQQIRHMSLRYTGPRRPRTDPNLLGTSEPVPGRYGMHFHEMEGHARGTIVQGVVVRDSGSHAFVSHKSHGVKFRDCITHNTFEEPYWWDASPNPDIVPAPPTDDVTYDRCVASLVRSDPPSWGPRLAGFVLGAREGNVIRNCVAVGVQGSEDSSGFIWPEPAGGLWTFEDCVAHNNHRNGIFVWQNDDLPHVVSRFIGYHNGHAGIKHGAYANGFLYENSILYANRFAGVEAHALSFSSPVQTFSRLQCDQAGLSPYCVATATHLAEPFAPVHFLECRFGGYATAAFGFVDQTSPFPNLFNIVNCAFEGNEFWLDANTHVGTRIGVQDPVYGALTLRRGDQPGTFKPEWNASVS